jgi:hypothetical protein
VGDCVSQDGSKKYEIKAVVKHEFKTYEDSAKDIIKNIRDKSMKVEGELPVYLIELQTVPNFLKENITQYIQDELQSINNLKEFYFIDL